MKKALALLLALGMLLALAACSADTGGAAEPSVSAAADATESLDAASGETITVLDTELLYPMPDGISQRGVVRIDDKLLLYGGKKGEPSLGLMSYAIAEDGSVSFSDVELLSFGESGDLDETMIYGICAGGDGYFYVLSGEYPPLYMRNGEYCTNDEYSGKIKIFRYSTSGERVAEKAIDSWPYDDAFEICVDADGNIYIYGNYYVSVLTWDGESAKNIDLPDRSIYSIQLCFAGVVLSVSGDDDAEYLRVGPDGSLTELSISSGDYERDRVNLYVGCWSQCQGLNGEYILDVNSAYWSCDFESGKAEELFQWSYGAYSEFSNYVCRIADDVFIGTFGSGSESYLLVSRLKTVPYKEREVVNIASFCSDFGGGAVEGVAM